MCRWSCRMSIPAGPVAQPRATRLDRARSLPHVCGIAGCALAPDQIADAAVLERMAAALHHRGPDDRGVEVIGSVGLASARLAIVDPTPRGHEPMPSADGRWWLTYNGEVFNHLSMRATLGVSEWRGGSDTETLVNALAEWGDGAPE